MKTILTHQEMMTAVREYYKLPADMEIVIEDRLEVADGWISNIGRDKRCYPDSLSPYTRVEVEYRNGDTKVGLAYDWSSAWSEADGHCFDIVAYRIIK